MMDKGVWSWIIIGSLIAFTQLGLLGAIGFFFINYRYWNKTFVIGRKTLVKNWAIILLFHFIGLVVFIAVSYFIISYYIISAPYIFWKLIVFVLFLWIFPFLESLFGIKDYKKIIDEGYKYKCSKCKEWFKTRREADSHKC